MSQNSFIENIDAKTRLAGSNKLEMLLFTLGAHPETGKTEYFGMNVFKIVEVIPMKDLTITASPGAPEGVAGLVSLRGNIVSVINLARAINLNIRPENNVLIVTEFNRHTQAFMAHAVDTIVRLDWENVQEPPHGLSDSTPVTAITRLEDGRIIQVLDIERVMSSILGFAIESEQLAGEVSQAGLDVLMAGRSIFFADDSSFARDQLRGIFDAAGVSYEMARNGQEAWDRLNAIALSQAAQGQAVSDRIPVIITDIEMPGMDGFTLTKKIKADRRFDGCKVIMHSSMSSKSNKDLGAQVGVDGYLAKFDAHELALQIQLMLA